MRCGVICEAALRPPGLGQSLPSAASADFYAADFFRSISCLYRFSSTWLKAIYFHELNWDTLLEDYTLPLWGGLDSPSSIAAGRNAVYPNYLFLLSLRRSKACSHPENATCSTAQFALAVNTPHSHGDLGFECGRLVIPYRRFYSSYRSGRNAILV